MALQDYELKSRLGRKSSSAPSEVWYAEDSAGNPVVVKLLKSRLPADVERFAREAAYATELVSPHVAQVWESGMEPEPYIVFEYVDGKDLSKVAPIRRLWEYLRTAEAIASGLAAIHEQGIAHRDIKPDNIRYERDGHAKIVDLGIALTNTATDSRLTVVPPGTMGWMAPERREGELLDVTAEQKADIFSVGLLLAYLRTGAHPFGEDQGIIESPDRNPDLTRVDEHLRDLLGRTLERDPAQRPDAKALLHELRRLTRLVPVSPRRGIARVGQFIRKFNRAYRRRIEVAFFFVVAAVVLAIILPYVALKSWSPPSVTTRPSASASATSPPVASDGSGSCPVGQYRKNPGDAVLKFGALLPMSGPLTAQGPQQFAAVELALNDIRATKGVPGIQIVSLDGVKTDEGDPVLPTACESTDALLKKNVDIIIGPSTSAVAHKVIDRVTSAGTILFSPSNTAPEFTDYPDKGLYFRTAASDALQGRILGKVVADEGSNNVLIVTRDDPYGNGLSREVERSLQLNQVNALPVVKYDTRSTNFTDLANRVKNLHPDAIVIIGFDETAKVLSSLQSVRITPQNTKIYGTEGNMRATLPGQVAPRRQDVLKGMRGTTRLGVDEKFAKRLNDSVGGGLVEFTYAPEVYDAVIVSALATASAGTDTPAKIAEKINEVTSVGEKCTNYADCLDLVKKGIDIDYDGVSGPLEFNDAGEPCVVSYQVVEFDDKGNLVPQFLADASNLCVQVR